VMGADEAAAAEVKMAEASTATTSTTASVVAPSPATSYASAPVLRPARTGVRLVECGALPGQHAKNKSAGGAAPQWQWAQLPGGQYMRIVTSTVKFANRETDKKRVENTLGLPEFGDATTEIWAPRDWGFIPVALGYDRIVYGDHGPYVELSPEHVCWPSFPIFEERPEGCYFDECYTEDVQTMLYYQKRTVKNKANPPSGAFAVHNNCKEGYANYVPGKLYVACETDTIAVCCSGVPQRRRKRAGRGKNGDGSSSVADRETSIGSDEDADDADADGEVARDPDVEGKIPIEADVEGSEVARDADADVAGETAREAAADGEICSDSRAEGEEEKQAPADGEVRSTSNAEAEKGEAADKEDVAAWRAAGWIEKVAGAGGDASWKSEAGAGWSEDGRWGESSWASNGGWWEQGAASWDAGKGASWQSSRGKGQGSSCENDKGVRRQKWAPKKQGDEEVEVKKASVAPSLGAAKPPPVASDTDEWPALG